MNLSPEQSSSGLNPEQAISCAGREDNGKCAPPNAEDKGRDGGPADSAKAQPAIAGWSDREIADALFNSDLLEMYLRAYIDGPTLRKLARRKGEPK